MRYNKGIEKLPCESVQSIKDDDYAADTRVPGAMAAQPAFDDHNQDFGAAGELAYEALADAFLGGPLGVTVIECFRTQFDGARVRYDFVSQEFGILDVNRYILTYFKPDPAEHGHPTNRAYYEWQKRRTK